MPSSTPSSRRAAKDDRIALRVTTTERDLIEQASTVLATTVSDFMLRASLARASEVLADRREFRLPPDQWDAFVTMLDQPPSAAEKPRLRRLLTTPSVLDG
jgi:uncharacterized protein (DUF1778 family)